MYRSDYPVVCLHVTTEEAAKVLPLEPTEQLGQTVQVLERADRGEVSRQRFVAECLDAILIHEAGEQVSDLLGDCCRAAQLPRRTLRLPRAGSRRAQPRPPGRDP